MLEKVKLALRISHNKLDSEIEDNIKEARAEMVRAGVVIEVAESELPLIEGAIKTYCKFKQADDSKLADGFYKSWELQLENIRKSRMEV